MGHLIFDRRHHCRPRCTEDGVVMKQSLSERILFGMWALPLGIVLGIPVLWLIFYVVGETVEHFSN